LKISVGSLGIKSYFVRGLPSNPLSPLTILVQKQLMYTNLLPPLDRQIQTAVSLLGYTSSLVPIRCLVISYQPISTLMAIHVHKSITFKILITSLPLGQNQFCWFQQAVNVSRYLQALQLASPFLFTTRADSVRTSF
jgi:hypothetical protein